jgi:hypothetical protein
MIKSNEMKYAKTTLICAAMMLLGLTAFSQVSLNVNKPLTAEDQQMVSKILSQFDPNSYTINVEGENGTLRAGKLRGLKDVKQGETIRPAEGDAAKTYTKINIFREAKAGSYTTINIFAAATRTTINIFKTAEYNEKQLDLLDQLYNVLSKYGEK